MSHETQILKSFVYAAVENFKYQKPEEKEIVNTDFVQKKKKKTQPIFKKSLSRLIAPFSPNHLLHLSPSHNLIKPITPNTNFQQQEYQRQEDYGKIGALIKDNSVLAIQCDGPDKPISIFRNNQKQTTKISLNNKEISKLLNQISEKTGKPLNEGIFKARIENLTIYAIISKLIGNRFIIKKNAK